MAITKKRILCVDDDRDSCEMMTALLELSGYEVISAQNYQEALAKASGDGFDLVLLDNRFPDGSGIELCREILSFHPDIPVVFYSGAAYEADRQEAIEAGAQAYLVKPTDIEAVEQTISGMLEDRVEVNRNKSRPDSTPRIPNVNGVLPPDSFKEVASWFAERTRARIERSRRLAEESRERINNSVSPRSQTRSAHD